MKKIILLLLASFLTANFCRADLIWYDNFNYPNGGITNSSGNIWFKFSGTGVAPGDMRVVNSNLQVTATSGTLINRADDCARWLTTTPGGPYTNKPVLLYASFTVICTTSITNGAGLPNGPGSYFASFLSQTNNTFPGFGYFGRVQAFTNGTALPNTWRLGVTDNGQSTNSPNGGFPVDLAVNTPYQVVEELDPITLQAATIWVNPININQTGSSPVDQSYTANDTLGAAITSGVNTFAFRQPGSFGNAAFLITNVSVATTFAEAATNVWSTNALPPTIVYQPTGVTNFPGSSFNLSVVANGQGLASLNYQWRMNSNSIANPSGNSNILPFTSVAANSGTNYYDVIVTTPYGLSVTSSVVLVAVNTAAQAPIFVSQPASQSLYAGQNAIFTVSVASPGNVTFTWYSNNIVISSGVTSSSFSSSIEIDNIVSANAATYKVAITNDVFPTGIVSTNAVLSVKVPAAVSIAYLHSLVSPTTYQPTNSPPTIAYQATGIVTISTNITTGNTSSYYLQDATGGINIFVTGGSTFRPQLGDVVTFVGVLSSFTSGLELYADVADNSFPYTSFTVLSNNIAALPTPKLISYNFMTNVPYANTNLGGLLVEIKDVYFGARAGTTLSTAANDTVMVTNSAGQPFFLFFPYLDQDVAGQTLPSYAYTVSGVVYSQNSVVTNEIVVTQFASLATTLNPAPIVLQATNKNLTLSWTNVVFGLQFSTNVSGPYTNISSATSPYTTLMTNSAGFYRLKF